MTKRYNSKVSVGIVLFLIIVLGSTSILMIFKDECLGLLVNLTVVIFIALLFKTTYYIIDHNKLIIRAFVFINIKIDISEIISIKKTRNPISSPANSLDRLEIRYNTKDTVLISPLRKIEFIENLQKNNPKIQYLN